MQNSHIFIQENAFENIVCEIAAILSRPQCVNRSKATKETVYKSSVASNSLYSSW